MKENKIKEMLNNMDYNTYIKMYKILAMGALGTGITANTIFSNYKPLNNSLELLSFTLLITYNYLYFSKEKYNTKDITETKNLYKEFLQNYNTLNKTFNLNNPIEIYTMYYYLLYKGYLSYNKEFNFTRKEARDLTPLLGTNIILGKGVCRHIAPLLTDILNTNNITTCNLGCCIKNSSININVIKEEKYTREEINEWLRKHNTNELLFDRINETLDIIYQKNKFVELTSKSIETKSILEKTFGNHAICFAHKDKFNYYLDPTQFRIYRLDANKLLFDNNENNITISNNTFLNEKETYKKAKKYFNKFPSIPIEEEETLKSNTINICKNNIDIFENFYNENKELYNNIAHKLIKFKKNPCANIKK